MALSKYHKDYLANHGYLTGSVLGAGGFGTVVEARSTFSKRKRNLAIKVISTEEEGSPLSELEILMSVDHPNLLKFEDALISKRCVFIVTAMAEKGSLKDYIDRNGAVDEFGRGHRWIKECVSGLNHLHDLGISHCDIKCANILISRKNTILLADFGLAKFAYDSTIYSTLCGTLNYLPPEKLLQIKHNPFRGDIFSLGIVFHKLLTSEFPERLNCKSKNICTKCLKQHQVSNDCVQLIVDMLSMTPHKRPTTTEMLQSAYVSAA